MVVIVAQLSYIEHGSQEVLMAATAFVRARIDETLKDEAAAVLAELGLTVSDVVRMTLTRVAKDHDLPFELKVPNAEKRAALESSRATMKARRPSFTDPKELLEERTTVVKVTGVYTSEYLGGRHVIKTQKKQKQKI